MPFSLPSLPFSKDALAPVISVETLEYHYGKHHQAYVDNLNKLIQGQPEAGKKLEEIIQTAEAGPLFNNAVADQICDNLIDYAATLIKPGLEHKLLNRCIDPLKPSDYA